MITIRDSQNFLSEEGIENLKKTAGFTLRSLELEDTNLTIVLEDDAVLRQLNKDFAGNDYVTDVLSFKADEIDMRTGEKYLGDVIISMDRVKAQAKDNNIAINTELINLAVHGILHLAGYDHKDQKSEKRMFTMQNQIVKSYQEL